MRRSLAAAVLVSLLLAGPLTSVREPVQAADSTAVAVNTHDGMDMFRLAFRINRVMSDTVDTGNAAAAVSSCTDCQTVAIAIQVVLILSDPTVVSPENVAIALNVECELCSTLASAYQFVLTTGGPVRFTPEGYQQLADIRRRLLELRHSDLTIVAIQAEVKALTTELAGVVRTQLVAAGEAAPPAGDQDGTTTTTAAGSSSGSSTTTTTSGATSTSGASSSSSSSSSSSTTSSSTTTPSSTTTTAPTSATTTTATAAAGA